MARGRGDAVALDALDRVYLRRCYELAERGRGGTSPNPCVGAVLVRDARTLGEGFHRRKGAPHAEVEALHAAAVADLDARGATAYVSLEPCNHHGATPPCSEALIAAGVSRVVAGCLDPNPRTAGGGVERLRGAGIVVDVVGAPEAEALVEEFAVAVTTGRPYLRLKMATSLDGFVSPERGRRHQLTGPAAGAFVRDLRGAYDAVLVGAETVRVDDPRLTVRPARSRHLPYRRIVLCGAEPVDPASNVFVPVDGYAPTIVLAAESRSAAFGSLERVAEVVSVPGDSPGGKLDLGFALAALRARGIASILCEGGPTLAGGLLEAGLVDRLDWLTAPLFLGGPEAVPVLNRANPRTRFRFDRVERLGEDLLQSGRPERK